MAGRPKSEASKKQHAQDEADILMEQAIELYRQEQQRTDEKPMGLRKVCDKIEAEYRKETGHTIKLNHNTLGNRIKGGKSMRQFNSEKMWLTIEEEKIIMAYTLESADRGFPLSHRRLQEHANLILRARLGSDFTGVGLHWSERFVIRHQDEIKTTWSRHLDSNRGRAVNATNHEHWFNLLGGTIDGVESECIWAADETGFQPGIGFKERVIGRKGKNGTYQQRDGNRENITVITTIGADGSSIPPAIIFKGKAFLMKWAQENPLGAS